MHPKTPSSSLQQQYHGRSLIRRRNQSRHSHHQRHEQESSLSSLCVSVVSPPPNLIETPTEESSSPILSSSSSSSSLRPFSFSPIDSHQDYDHNVDDYVNDTVIVKHPYFSRDAASLSSSICRFLKKTVLLTVPLLVAICSIFCCPCIRINLPLQINSILFFFSRSPQTHCHFSRLVYLEPQLSSEGQGKKVKVSLSMEDTTPLDANTNTTTRTIFVNSIMTTKKQRLLSDDDSSQEEENYDQRRVAAAAAPEFETHECKAQYQWQLDNLVTCNRIHEVDMTTMTTTTFQHQQPMTNTLPLAIRHLGSGFWRDAWMFMDNDINNKDNKDIFDQQQQNMIVLKTMRYHHDYIPRNLDRHRRDAMTAEHYTKSRYIINIYAYCGNSAFFEYGNHGDLEHVLGMKKNDNDGENEDSLTLLERFHIAVQAAMSLATLHNFDREGVSAIAHADLTLDQFISVNGTIKLNDFNRARFIAWNATSNNAPCPYYIANNPGFMRSPEEYKYEPQTEKVDVYSFGNVLYVLLMLEWPFYEVDYEEDGDADDYGKFIGDQVIQGRRPFIPDDVWNSSNAIEQALVMAIRMCFEPDPKKRVSARQVETFLISQLEKIDPGRLEMWGGGTST